MMTFEMHSWGSEPSTDGGDRWLDHWLDDALRAVPVPDGFLARLNRLADAPVDGTEHRDDSGERTRERTATRGLSTSSAHYEASRRDNRLL
jgi:hypothetical protein